MDSYNVDVNLYIKIDESLKSIEKSLKVMNSEMKYADFSDLDSVDQNLVKRGIKESESCVRKLEEFHKYSGRYMNSFGFIKLDYSALDDYSRRSVMRKIGEYYDEIYDLYSDYWCIYHSLAKYNYVSDVKFIKPVK